MRRLADLKRRVARSEWRHWMAFGLCGLLATVTDIGTFVALNDGLGVEPLVARCVAIGAAVVVGWRAHRRFTFKVKTPPTLAEFLRYLGLAWASILVNYAVFALLVKTGTGIEPVVAIVISSGVAMIASYLGMRFGVFRNAGDSTAGNR